MPSEAYSFPASPAFHKQLQHTPGLTYSRSYMDFNLTSILNKIHHKQYNPMLCGNFSSVFCFPLYWHACSRK